MRGNETDAMRDVFAKCHDTAVDKGWWINEDVSDPNSMGAKIALMHSELSEALEEVRKGDDCYEPYFNSEKPNKPEGLVVELADCVIRAADLCGAMGLDLAEAIEMKMQYNETRDHRHGGKKL